MRGAWLSASLMRGDARSAAVNQGWWY